MKDTTTIRIIHGLAFVLGLGLIILVAKILTHRPTQVVSASQLPGDSMMVQMDGGHHVILREVRMPSGAHCMVAVDTYLARSPSIACEFSSLKGD